MPGRCGCPAYTAFRITVTGKRRQRAVSPSLHINDSADRSGAEIHSEQTADRSQKLAGDRFLGGKTKLGKKRRDEHFEQDGTCSEEGDGVEP